MEQIREKLFQMQDKKYRQFHSRLCPNVDNIIGVRLPKLRKLAKEISKENAKDFLETTKLDYYEEKMLYGMVIGYRKVENIKETFSYLDKFVPIIDNWAICDCCCATYKFTLKQLEEVFNYLQKYLKSNKEFELRFAIIMLMDYYLNDEYVDKVLKIYDNIKHEGYYVKMAVAWAIATCYVKYPKKIMKYLQNNNLDDFTYNKALQKMIESYRVPDRVKQICKKMKR